MIRKLNDGVTGNRVNSTRWVVALLLASGVAIGAMLTAGGQKRADLQAAPQRSGSASADAAPISEETASILIEKLSRDMATTLRASRVVMLGSRNPNGNSCVTPIQNGQVVDAMPSNAGDLDGGPGTRMATLYTLG